MRREILGCTSTREDGVYPTNVNIKNKTSNNNIQLKITKIGKNTIKIVQKHYLELKTSDDKTHNCWQATKKNQTSYYNRQ